VSRVFALSIGIICNTANVIIPRPSEPTIAKSHAISGAMFSIIEIVIVIANPIMAAIKLDEIIEATNTSKGTGIIACLMLSLSLGSFGYRKSMCRFSSL
jgi:hypothetical protein